MYDLVIVGGTVVDGTGGARRQADIGVTGGRIVAIGDLAGAQATSTIDATGRIVAPGFIDVHTHVDAQVFWDTTVSPSPLHGVTTVIAGNCGFSVQPLGDDPRDGDYLMRMLSRVEGLPLTTLQKAVPWNWSTTEEYLNLLDGTLAINSAFKVGHSAVRRVVMGTDATRREATADEVAAMCALLRDGVEAGAIGFSSSWSRTHNDTEQNMVPSRYASRDELLALCAVLAEYPGTSLEFIPMVGDFTDEAIELMAEMSVVAKAPLNWNVLTPSPSTAASTQAKLAASDVAAARGGKVVALTAPMTIDLRMNFASGFILDSVPGFEEVMLLPHDEKRAALSNPSERERLRKCAAEARGFTNWSKMMIFRTVSPENQRFAGRMLSDVADELGTDPWNALCDIALADNLETSFGYPPATDSEELWALRADLWRDPRAVIGASDAGAHLDMFFTGHYATVVLREAVAKRRLLSLEEAISLLTAVPADLYMLRDRGRLVEGAYADLIVFDEMAVGSGPIVERTDLPEGATRLYAEGEGIDHVIVNGTEIVRAGVFTDARPGTVLRQGIHTGV